MRCQSEPLLQASRSGKAAFRRSEKPNILVWMGVDTLRKQCGLASLSLLCQAVHLLPGGDARKMVARVCGLVVHANFNLNLSLPESDRIRLVVKIQVLAF